MNDFDPNAPAGKNSGIFGLPYSVEESKIVLLPVPWEATTSYGGGTSRGPHAILQASKQVDLFDGELGNFFKVGISLVDESNEVLSWNDYAKKAAQIVIQENASEHETREAINKVNSYSMQLNEYVYAQTKYFLNQNKIVGIIGGDHSSPFGAIKAYLEKYPAMGILHIDAHADLRKAYEGFENSHASIMYNVISKTPVRKLVQVGIRDFCEDEYYFIQQNPERITTFFDEHLFEQKINGKPWSLICAEIVEQLPLYVYISFDIDGLDPRFCPHTGTPVPGGLEYREVLYLIKQVVKSGRKIVGFDLNEVAPGIENEIGNVDTAAEWDANVGARLLYKLCGWSMQSDHPS